MSVDLDDLGAGGSMTERLLPVDDDVDTGGFFEAARRGELALRMCNSCDAVLHVPRQHCRHCGSWDGRWQVVDAAATLYSWTTVTHQVHPSFPVPYTVLLVELDALPGTRLVSHLPGAPELRVGMPLEPWFEQLGETGGRPVIVPQWRPSG